MRRPRSRFVPALGAVGVIVILWSVVLGVGATRIADTPPAIGTTPAPSPSPSPTHPDVDDLIAYFLALKGQFDDGNFRRRFDLMALQRNLKALGTFGYQTITRRNPVYIQYVPRTLRYARLNLEKYDRFARLLDLLSTHIEELR